MAPSTNPLDLLSWIIAGTCFQLSTSYLEKLNKYKSAPAILLIIHSFICKLRAAYKIQHVFAISCVKNTRNERIPLIEYSFPSSYKPWVESRVQPVRYLFQVLLLISQDSSCSIPIWLVQVPSPVCLTQFRGVPYAISIPHAN